MDGNYYIPRFMILLIWIVWLFNQFLIFIILLNFLIAIISESYLDTLSRADFYKYKERCEMNIEVMLSLEFLNKLSSFECFILSAHLHLPSHDTELENGLQTVKNFITNEN